MFKDYKGIQVDIKINYPAGNFINLSAAPGLVNPLKFTISSSDGAKIKLVMQINDIGSVKQKSVSTTEYELSLLKDVKYDLTYELPLKNLPTGKYSVQLIATPKEGVYSLSVSNFATFTLKNDIFSFFQVPIPIYLSGTEVKGETIQPIVPDSIPTPVPTPAPTPVATPFSPNMKKTPGNVEVIVDKPSPKVNFNIPNLKLHLYKELKNKVSFQMERFFPVYNYDVLKINEIKNKQGSERLVYNLVNDFLLETTTAIIYRTETIPDTSTQTYESILKSIVDDQNIYKVLNVSDNQLQFTDFLEVNKDYYFAIEGTHKTKNGVNFQGFSAIQKVKIIKDEELYFLENEVIANNLYVKKKADQKKVSKLNKKIFIEPNFQFNPTNFNDNGKLFSNNLEKVFISSTSLGFNSASNTKFIKLRITSKKSNKKVDINLNYNGLPYIQDSKSYEELNGKDVTKLNYIPAIRRQSTIGNSVDAVENFISKLNDYAMKFNSEKNRNITLIRTNEVMGFKELEVLNTYGPLDFLYFVVKFINENNLSMNLLKLFTSTLV